MKKTTKWVVIGLAALAVLGGGFAYYQFGVGSDTTAQVAVPTITQENGKTVKSFTLTAKEQRVKLKSGTIVPAWTYDGTTPGSQIRVTEGDVVRVTLKNDLSKPTTIHWHGVPVPNNMDGIPGVTQNAIQPGQSFTYEFTATTPGTYWYHSHQNSSVQEDMGLYGSLIIEPKEQPVKYDQDVTLVLDEWMTGMTPLDHEAHGMGSSDQKSHDQLMKEMYDVFTVNGRAAESIQPLDVKQGEHVKLRLINAGFQTRLLHLGNTPFKITHSDGQPISAPTEISDQLVAIAPGERYELDFTAGADSFWIDDHTDSKAASDVRIPVQVNGKKPSEFAETTQQRSKVDITTYGKKSLAPNNKPFDQEYTLNLNNKKTESGEEVFTINDKLYPNIDPLHVKKDQWVKVTMKNVGTANHPMHLHGHFFQVLSHNGKPVEGGITEKDTLLVPPGETYEIAFHADNEGMWMFHCHDLHHAAAGMMTHVEYDGYKPDFVPDPSAGNVSE